MFKNEHPRFYYQLSRHGRRNRGSVSLSGEEMISHSDRQIQAVPVEKKQIISVFSGNRCGHNPKIPKHYIRPLHHKERPPILESAIQNLEKFYHNPSKWLKKLSVGRQRRTERREAIMAVSQVILHYLELWKLEVGILKQNGDFIRFNLKYIAQKAGLTIIRAKRALLALAKAGYLRITRRYKLPSIRSVSRSFFYDLGIKPSRLFAQQEWKRKAFENKVAKNNRSILPVISPIQKKTVPIAVSNSSAEEKRLINKALEMHKQNSSISLSEYLAKLKASG